MSFSFQKNSPILIHWNLFESLKSLQSLSKDSLKFLRNLYEISTKFFYNLSKPHRNSCVPIIDWPSSKSSDNHLPPFFIATNFNSSIFVVRNDLKDLPPTLKFTLKSVWSYFEVKVFIIGVWLFLNCHFNWNRWAWVFNENFYRFQLKILWDFSTITLPANNRRTRLMFEQNSVMNLVWLKLVYTEKVRMQVTNCRQFVCRQSRAFVTSRLINQLTCIGLSFEMTISHWLIWNQFTSHVYSIGMILSAPDFSASDSLWAALRVTCEFDPVGYRWKRQPVISKVCSLYFISRSKSQRSLGTSFAGFSLNESEFLLKLVTGFPFVTKLSLFFDGSQFVI